MNKTVRRPETLTGLHDLSRHHLWISNETTDRYQDLGAETRFRVRVDRHELLANHHPSERDVSCHWRDDLAAHCLLKVNRSVPSAKFARRFDVRICHSPVNGRNQTIGSNQKGKKNHQSLCAIAIALR